MTPATSKTIIISATIIIVAIIIYFLVRPINDHPRMDEQEPVTCVNKTVYRYKYPSEFFPLFAQEYNTQVSLTSDLLKRFSDSIGTDQIGVDAKNEIVDLQEKLNQDNITFSTALRTYFINSNSDPCNDSLRQKFLAFTDEMARRVLDLKNTTSLVTEIEKPADSTKTAPAPSSGSASDTGTLKLPKYAIVKDTARIKTSINRLNQVLKTNNNFNRRIKVVR
jgi:hypothetical protein